MIERHAALAAFLLIVAACWFAYTPAPTGRDKALLLCRDCGITPAEIDSLIAEARILNDPATSRALWENTYTDAASLAEARKLCGPCVEATIQSGIDQATD